MNVNDRKIIYTLLEQKKKSLFFVYIIKAYRNFGNKKVFDIYVGASYNIMDRLRTHANGINGGFKYGFGSFSNKTPSREYINYKLVYLERFNSEYEMLSKESEIIKLEWNEKKKIIDNFKDIEENRRMIYEINKTIFFTVNLHGYDTFNICKSYGAPTYKNECL